MAEKPESMTYRESAPVSGLNVPNRALEGKAMKNGNIFASRIDLQNSALVRSEVETTIQVSNGATIVSRDDPDVCTKGTLIGTQTGIEYRVRVEPEWTQPQVTTQCSLTAAIGTNDIEHSFSFAAPASPGIYRIIYYVELPDSGQEIQFGRSIRIDCENDADCPTGSECVGGDCQRIRCSSTADCPPGTECRGGECVPIEDGGGDGDDGRDRNGDDGDNGDTGGCTSNADCPQGQVCQNGQCVTPQRSGLAGWWNNLSSNEKLLVVGGAGLGGAILLTRGGGDGPRFRRG